MILYFLRHSQAEPFNQREHESDRDRHLTPQGLDLMRQASLGFIKMGLHFERILSSPYPRALESAKILAEVFKLKHEIHISENLTPEALFHQFRKELISDWTKFDSLLIVTHQPFVGECISYLLGGKDASIVMDIGTATLCALEIDPALKSAAILNFVMKAEQAALIGKNR